MMERDEKRDDLDANARQERRRAVMALSGMVAFAGLAKVLTPDRRSSDQLPPLQLDESVAATFGTWSWDRSAAAPLVEPQQAALLSRLYAQTLSRVYVDVSGRSVMLSIAYGQDQRDGLQLHYPEVCYPAQGFEVMSRSDAELSWGAARIPVRQLRTALARQRYEPITYWTTVGGEVVRGGIDKKLAEMRHGLKGTIPDGLLVRISSLDLQAEQGFATHAAFARALIDQWTPPLRRRFAGV